MRLLKKGKVKDIYEIDADHLLFEFTNRISAFDVILPSTIPRKGEILCKFGAYWFETLGTPHHMIEAIWPNKMVVKRLQIIPIECVVRGYLYGSLYERLVKREVKLQTEPLQASELPVPIFDPTTKSDEKDLPITKETIIEKKVLSENELSSLEDRSIGLYLKMKAIAEKAGFIIADVKFEFGKDLDGAILLADSIGPDEFRLWPKSSYEPGRAQESFDKQVLRDWLVQVGFKKQLDDAPNSNKPKPPSLPQELIGEITRRYVYAYEQITGRKLDNKIT